MEELTEDILRQAAQGDVNAFEAVYRSYATFVYNVAYRISLNREDAEEVTQEVFITVYKQLSSFLFQSSFKTWVYRVTVNSALNMVKKNKYRRADVAFIDEAHQGVGEHAVIEAMNNEDNQEKVKRLLNILNPDERACVVLRSIENLSYEEVAQSLNVNINTIRTRLKRAREKMMKVSREVIQDEL